MSIFPDYGQGRCFNCGFLAASTGVVSLHGDYKEVTLDHRASGYVKLPCCVRRVTSLSTEYNETDTALKEEQRIFAVITKERMCSQWYQYAPGLNPKEHLADLHMLELEQRRQEFERMMEQRHQEFLGQLETDRRGFEVKLNDRAVKQGQRDRKVGWFIGGAGILLAVAEVITAIMQFNSPNTINNYYDVTPVPSIVQPLVPDTPTVPTPTVSESYP